MSGRPYVASRLLQPFNNYLRHLFHVTIVWSKVLKLNFLQSLTYWKKHTKCYDKRPL